jgi:hypothetical protein
VKDRVQNPGMTSSLKELAQQRLDHFQRLGRLKDPPTVDWIWVLSALRSVVEGKPVDPEIDALKQFTTRARIWEGLKPAWPPDHVGAVIVAIVSSHRLAIVKRDDDWLTELLAGWDGRPEYDVHYLLQLRVEGEIGLGLAPGGSRPFGWSEEEIVELEEEGFLGGDEPSERVWCALARRDFEAARRAFVKYEQFLAALPEKWEAAPKEGLFQILSMPDLVLQVQRRALAALLDRARP